MIFTEATLSGAYVIGIEPLEDDRGFFARLWCQHEFAANGLNSHLAQCNVSFNRREGTLRGMHYQALPYQEAKLVRCTKGRVYDVIIDLRPTSATYKEWFGIQLRDDGMQMLYIPEGLAHGFLTLERNTEVFYQISVPYAPEAMRGVRWNDPAFGVNWPTEPRVMSERDRQFPDYDS